MSRLSNKVAIVTGAASGFGEAIAHGFASEGAHVIVADIAVEAGERVVSEITAKKYTGSAIFANLNVVQRNSWESALALAKDKFGKLDIVVNNAGTTYKKQPSMEVSEEDFDRILAVNVKSIYMSVSVVMPYFVEKKAGVFLNTSSVAGTRVRPGQVFYGGTKGFLNTVRSIIHLLILVKKLTFQGHSRACCGVRAFRCACEQYLSSPWSYWPARNVQWCRGHT